MNPKQDYDYIDSDAGLAQFCRALGGAECCAIDTEFIRESTYYPELALIQIASDELLACIDPLAIDDFTPLAGLLVNDKLLKVFHSSSQDLEILYQKFGEVPCPVFDTQLAAAVLGYNHQVSYADLVQQVTGVALEKKHTRANWMRRPLSGDELDYAMDDVRYLLAVYEHLNQRLEATRRRGWLDRDLQAISDPANYEIDRHELWKRLKGVQKLKGEKLQIASDLCQWREELAQQQNRPRRWIVKDEVIVEIARLKPESIESLAGIPSLGDKTVKRHGEKLLKIIGQAARVDASQWPRHDRLKSLDSGQLALGDCLMALCRLIADQNDIALATLATRKDIDNLILNQKSSRLTQGWRFSMAGEQLLEFIHGQSTISVADQSIRLDPK
ncbi:MAG: ribonuclease D [Gammaproteobacteria bacterium]|nr:ribonuclease D [Gammaproteobacteria bacterium]MDH3534715.1 ribonuclease D [Gammaproteobacteria bacterium]